MTALLPETTTPATDDREVAALTVRSERAERLALMAERRRAERSKELIDLQQERPDLVGAYAPADFAADALRWAV